MIWYILVGVLLHFESLSILGIKIAPLWKGLFILFVFSNSRIVYNASSVIKIYWFIFITGLISSIINGNLFVDIAYHLRVLLIPCILSFILTFGKGWDTLKAFLSLATFVLFASGLYFFGLLEPITESIELTSTGEVLKGFVGFFQKPHGANSIFSIISITSLVFIVENKPYNKRLILIFLVAVLMMFSTYVRTGLLALFLVTLYLSKERTYYSKKMKLSILMVSMVVSVFYVQGNEAVKNRLLDKTENNLDKDYTERVGSSRLLIWAAYLDMYKSSSVVDQIIGVGEEKAKTKFEKRFGMKLIPHNGFIEVLVFRGLIGVFLYTILLRELWSKQSFESRSDILLIRSYVIFIISLMLTQGVNLVYEFVFISLGILSKKQKSYVKWKSVN